MRTLEEYFKSECAKGTLDFALRATLVDGVVSLYIHPAGRHGDTTPTLIVEGDSVRPKFPAPAGGAPITFLNGTCPRCGSGSSLTVNSLPPPVSATLYPIPLAVTAAHVPTLVDGVVSLYIHPAGRHGDTTPTLIVEGDSVRPKFPAPAGGAPITFLNGTCPRCGSGSSLTVNSLPPPVSATLYPIPLAVTAAHVPTTVPATFVGTTLVGLPAADALGTVEFQHTGYVGNDVAATAAARAAAIAATENALADTVNALAPSQDGEV
jgi:ribosomal protein S27AE